MDKKVYSVLSAAQHPVTDALTVLQRALNTTSVAMHCTAENLKSCLDQESFRASLMYNIHTTTAESRGDDLATYGVYLNSPTSSDVQVAEILEEVRVTSAAQFGTDASLCSVNCTTKCGHLSDRKHIYIHGERIIVVAFNVLGRERDSDGHCKGMTVTTLLRSAAALDTFQYLKDVKLKDDKTGLLLVDACGGKLASTDYIYGILTGATKICTRLGDSCLEPKNIITFITFGTSAGTRHIQPMLREMQIPQIAVGVTAIELNDQNEYPYLLRPNPSDDLQVHFMVELLRQINRTAGSSVGCVNIIYTDELYGLSAAKALRESLANASVCVSLYRAINATDSRLNNSFSEVVNEILERADVRISILFIDEEAHYQLLDAVKQREDEWRLSGNIFISSDTGSTNLVAMKQRGYEQIIRGNFIFNFNTDFNSTGLIRRLGNMDYKTASKLNPWLHIYKGEAGLCKERGNFYSSYSSLCKEGNPSFHSANVYEQYTLLVLKAITATFYAIQSMYVGVNNSEPLNKPISYRYNKLLDVEIPETLEEGSPTHRPFSETQWGNGRVGFTISHVKIAGDHNFIITQQTGFESKSKLKGFEGVMEFPNGSATSANIKSVCQQAMSPTSPETSSAPETFNNLHLAIVLLSVGCVVALVVTAVLLIRRRNAKVSAEDGKELPAVPNVGPYGHLISKARRLRIWNYLNGKSMSDYDTPDNYTTTPSKEAPPLQPSVSPADSIHPTPPQIPAPSTSPAPPGPPPRQTQPNMILCQPIDYCINNRYSSEGEEMIVYPSQHV